jgi:exonuclease I
MKKICWIDLETTGVDCKKDSIIEFAALYGDQELHLYCKPVIKPENWDFIEGLTGITWEFLEKNGVPEKELYLMVSAFFYSKVDRCNKKDKIIFAGYNCKFDNDFIRELFAKYDNKYFGSLFFSCMLDVLCIMSDALYNDKIKLQDNYKLETSYKAIIKKEFNAHSAIEDIKATKELYEFLKNLKNEEK